MHILGQGLVNQLHAEGRTTLATIDQVLVIANNGELPPSERLKLIRLAVQGIENLNTP